MKIVDIRAIEGRNIHSHYPVIEMLVDLEERAETDTSTLPHLADLLVRCMPGIASHHCALGAPGGFLTRVREGTYLGHVVEHVALELLIACDHRVMYGKTRHVCDSTYKVVFEYQLREAGLAAGERAVEIVNALVAGSEPEVSEHLEAIQALTREYELGPSTSAIAKAAHDRGIPVMRFPGTSILQLGYGSKQRLVEATITARTSCIAVDIACDKALAKMLLSEFDIPVPEGGVARTLQEAVLLATQLGYPIVIKPKDGNQGKGVSLNIRTEREIPAAFLRASQFSREVIVERYLVGRHYRLLVVGGKLAAASERLPAFVVGDGQHSIEELVVLTNQDAQRGEDHERPLTRIRLDDAAQEALERQNLSLKSIPGRGNMVYLRENANLSTGGVAIDVTDQVHPDNARLAVRAAEIIGLDVAGVDLITDHISLPVESTGGAVVEINAAPGIRMHHYPWKGRPRDVGRQIVDYLFPGGSGRIPVVAVSGTNGKTTVVRMISHVLTEAGYVVGMTCTDGVFIDGEKVMTCDASGPRSARAVLRCPDVDAAVLETARGGIIREGLAFDRCDVAVLTNIADDHLGQDGIEDLDDLAKVKSLIIEAVMPRGYAVLNADDPMCLGVASRASGRTMLFSARQDNIAVRKHVSSGGRAVVLRNAHIVMVGPESPRKIVSVKSIPATFGGRAMFNVHNALAATAACLALGIDFETIADALGRFKADASTNPGRLNVIEMKGFCVVLDYGHNPPAIEASAQAIRTMFSSRSRKVREYIGVIASPGDRAQDKIKELGKTAAAWFDRIVIKEDADLRGRRPGETAGLLRQGALAGATEQQVECILDESLAIKAALEYATCDDVVVVYYEKYDEAYESVMRWMSELEPSAFRGEEAEPVSAEQAQV